MLRFSLTVVISLGFFFSCAAQSNPIIGIFDPNCRVYSGDGAECPNENVTFWLYTNETRNSPKQLNALKLDLEDFKVKRPLKILIHGYTGHRDFAPNEQLRPALLDHDDVYVISVDYKPLVPEPCYFAAVSNLPLASKCLAQLINNLVESESVRNEDIHVIGFSLGAHVAGQTANYVNTPLKRITGLDPAKPMFITANNEHRLDASDAEFLDVIHTDVLGRGLMHHFGHIDFYPNFGPVQPGCQEELPNDPGSCNHLRAVEFYAESIASYVGFWGYACPSWIHHQFGLCHANDQQALMGYHVNTSQKGVFFLTTNAKRPFAKGKVPYKPLSDEEAYFVKYYNQMEINDEDFEPILSVNLQRTLKETNFLNTLL